MKKFLLSVLCFATVSFGANAVTFGVPAGAAANAGRATNTQRGYQQLGDAYRQNQRNTYYVVNAPDVDTACRNKIFQCLADYCGDVTVIPGQRDGRCTGASEGELYNWVLLCLQRDNESLIPNFASTVGGGGMNTAARLCPSYVQQELMAYLSMANMAEQLNKQRSDTCVQRRRELEAAMSCHQVALSTGAETHNRLVSTLTDYCGTGVPGGSGEMVTRFANAGNLGANIFGWAEKILTLDMSKKGPEWKQAVDDVLAGYVNRMNLACGENLQMQFVERGANTGPTALQTAATVVVGNMFKSPPVDQTDKHQAQRALFQEFRTIASIYDFGTARQTVWSALSNQTTTQSPYLTSSTMGDMQAAYKLGVKVFVLRDSARCFVIPLEVLDNYENQVIAQQLSECRFN
ncbi:MAG: hypothetical protein FWG39_03670 [Alphaproteobacteria bacterium]|nr:hypothetical protein [Alphaproteobacteria bacterium]